MCLYFCTYAKAALKASSKKTILREIAKPLDTICSICYIVYMKTKVLDAMKTPMRTAQASGFHNERMIQMEDLQS
jgi:hypothetical protein